MKVIDWLLYKNLVDIYTDCRAYIENSEDQFSKPLKCGYDPYTNIWEDWSANPLKQNAIKYYSFEEFLRN